MSVKVTCAIIEHEGKVLCAQRSRLMIHPHKWEFPGGKVEENENLETCLKREIKEGLGIEIEVLEQFAPINRDILKLLPLNFSSFEAKFLLRK